MKYSIADRIIPCPKHINAKGGYSFYKNRIKVELKVPESEIMKIAYDMLDSFCTLGHIKPDFVITFRRIDEHTDPDRRLDKCKTTDQAYIIKPVLDNGVYAGLDLMAYTDIGLYYAASTLFQTIEEVNDKEVEIPFIDVADWPTVAYRGLFLGDYLKNIKNTSLLKYNALDDVYNTKNREKKNDIYIECDRYGVTVFTVLFSWGDSEDAIRKTIQQENKKNILFWISDDADENELFEETVKLIEIYRDLKKTDAELKMGIVTNFKGDKVFDKLNKLTVPEGFLVSYCDKNKTYDTNVKDIVAPSMAGYSKGVGEFGIYPLIAFDEKSFFPWTAPEFIQYRCSEFARIKANKVMGFSPFACSFNRFNIAALSEWLWNPRSRNTVDFIRAYSYREDLDFDKFENFLYYISFASWSLQRSGFIQCITEDEINLKNLKAFPRVNQMISDSYKAMKIAECLTNKSYAAEARVTYCSIGSYIYTKKLLDLISHKKYNKKKFDAYRAKLEEAAKSVYEALMEWGELMKVNEGAYETFVYDTAKAFLYLPKHIDILAGVTHESEGTAS
jgi:hypothetical protein